jgi:ribosomal protein L40E
MRHTDDPRELCDPLVQTAVAEQWSRNCVRCGARWPLRCGVCGTCIGRWKMQAARVNNGTIRTGVRQVGYRHRQNGKPVGGPAE